MCTIPKNFRFSFSKLQLYNHCPMAFKMTYLDQKRPDEDEDNAYADYGSFCHGIFEQWAKGEILDFMMASVYAEGFEEAIKHPFPPFPAGAYDTYYHQGLEYFENFTGFGDQYDILEVEEKFHFDLFGNTISGIADLILQDKETGDIIVIDHKSKSKQGMLKDLDEYRHQLYLYSHYIMARYGRPPKKLMFNVFRENYMYEEEFSEERYNETIKWTVDTIDKILAEPDWNVNVQSFYCRNICGVFNSCPMRDTILYPPPVMVTYHGEEMSVLQLAELTGIPKATLTRRLNKGMTAEDAVEQKTKKGKKRNDEEECC